MAKSTHAWGIDIGHCGLKALRCRAGAEPGTLEVDAFEYIEYPLLLSDPEANRVELVRNALKEMLERHDLRDDKVVLSVPGQAGLTKYIKLPPIEARKIPDIVRYEARQQIPFPIDQVVWDWQRLPGGMEEAGFIIDAEVAIVAMKREQVFKMLQPLTDVKIDVDILQLAPVALANMLIFDRLPDPATLDPDSPPPFTVVVSTGVESTDLVVTNGLQIWQRSIPIGGSNFTKAIVSSMKMTFSKAEHLKRNAVRAENAKDVFLAMRPVFNDFAAELQRSLNYFTGTHKTASIAKVFLLGNAVKLRGLSDFVGKQLGLEVERMEQFVKLDGKAVTSASAFRDNRLAFGTAYGLAAQGLGLAAMKTSLMPQQIIRDRLIDAKKPLTVAALILLVVSAFAGFTGTFVAWTAYAPSIYQDALASAEQAATSAKSAVSAVDQAETARTEAITEQHLFLRLSHRRFETLQMLRAVRSLLPQDPADNVPEDPADRNELHIDSIDMQYFPDLTVWFDGVRDQWALTHPSDGALLEDPPAATAADPAAAVGEADAAGGGDAAASTQNSDAASGEAADGEAEEAGPSGPGWVIEIVGHHFHNEDRHKPQQSAQFVRSTLISNIVKNAPMIPVDVGPQAGSLVSPAEFGIGYPVLVQSSTINRVQVENPVLANKLKAEATRRPVAIGAGLMGSDGSQDDDRTFGGGTGIRVDAMETMVELRRFDFVLQFCWVPRLPGAPPPAATGETASAAGE